MIKCTILIEEVKSPHLSIAVIPETDDVTDLERQAWAPYSAAFAVITEWQMRTADAKGSHLLSGGEDIRDMIEERLKNIDPLRRKKDDVELFAWVGEDEFGSGVVGLKQAKVPAGLIPMVATSRDKMTGNNIPDQLQKQATEAGKTIRLCRFVFAEELITLAPQQ